MQISPMDHSHPHIDKQDHQFSIHTHKSILMGVLQIYHINNFKKYINPESAMSFFVQILILLSYDLIFY
jgi:hypothetical protein